MLCVVPFKAVLFVFVKIVLLTIIVLVSLSPIRQKTKDKRQTKLIATRKTRKTKLIATRKTRKTKLIATRKTRKTTNNKQQKRDVFLMYVEN